MNNINDTMIYTLLQQPFYGSLLASVVRVETYNIPTAGVTIKDRPILYYNPDFLNSLEPKHTSGVLIHELLHLILLHQFRANGRDHKIWNIACDLAVNQLIDHSSLPEGALTVNEMSKMTTGHLRYAASAEEYYAELIKDKDAINAVMSMGDNSIEITIADSDGNEAKYTVNTLDDLKEDDRELVKAMLKNSIESAKQAGSVPSSIERQLSNIYSPPQMNWRMLLRNFLNSRGRLKYEYTYKRESRRFPGAPGKRKLVGMNILIGIDESGSVSDKDLTEFINELRAIQKITGSNVFVVPFDSEAGKPIPLRQYIMRGERTRSGGTVFEPVFELAQKMRIDTVVIFTDGYASIPEEIAPKTLWVVTGHGRLPEKGTAVQFSA